MGKLDLFKVVITNPQCVVQAGGKVTGYVLVTLNANMKMRGVFITFKGKQHVKFEKHTGSNDSKTCSATEYSFDEQHALFKPTGGPDHCLLQGEHRFDFQYQLKTSLPSTFEGKYGYVRYYVKCTIDRPWKFDHTVKEAFTVLSILDLNCETGAEMPVYMEKHDTSFACCGCCEEGEATLKLDLPRRGYVPGESIPVTAELDSTIADSLGFTVELWQKITYSASGKRKKEKQMVGQLEPVRVVRTLFRHTGEKLPIPPIPPSRLVGCKLIDICYTLKVSVDGGLFTMKCKVDIIIGTVPFHSVYEMYRAPHTAELAEVNLEPSAPPFVPNGATPALTDPSYPTAPAYPTAPPTQYGGFEAPPPSYEMCVFGKTNIRDENDDQFTMGSANYAPHYTYYNWS